MADKKIKLLIVDDSSVVQLILSQIFSQDTSIEIVGTASDPYIARDLIKKNNPDVITLDIEMPRMDGLTFLKNLMRLHPLPVVMLSSFTDKANAITIEALALGAVDYIRKPRSTELANIDAYASELIRTVKNASGVHIRQTIPHFLSNQPPDQKLTERYSQHITHQIIAIGASTGGIEAIDRILQKLPSNMPGIVIVQHIHQEFSKAFVERLNHRYHFIAEEAADDLEVQPGHIIVAKGGAHLELYRKHGRFFCQLHRGDKVSGHIPSIDTLFHSLAKTAGSRGTAVLLTGMGKDGALGMQQVKEAGGETIAQDENSSIVWGMPGTAVSLKAAKKILPVDEIADYLLLQLTKL